MTWSPRISELLKRAQLITSPTTYSDGEFKTRLLSAIALLSFALSLVYSFVWVLTMPAYLERLVISLPLALLIGGLPLLLIRKGNMRLASLVSLGGAWVFVTLVTATAGGTRAPFYGLYLLIAMSGAVLCGHRLASVIAVTEVIGGLVMVYLDGLGLIPSPIATPISAWLTQTTIMVLLWAIWYIVTRRSDQTLHYVRDLLGEREKGRTSTSAERSPI